jgi:hypothetical protein
VKWNEKTLFFYFEDDHARIMSGSKDVERRMSSDNPESIVLSPTKKKQFQKLFFSLSFEWFDIIHGQMVEMQRRLFRSSIFNT